MIENRILFGNSLDILKTLPGQSVDCCVTSPPYYLMRDYGGIGGQMGLEDTPGEYIENLAAVFKEAKRVLKDTGTLWVVIGDSYAGSGKGGQGKHIYAHRNKEIPKKHSWMKRRLPRRSSGFPGGLPWLCRRTGFSGRILSGPSQTRCRNPAKTGFAGPMNIFSFSQNSESIISAIRTRLKIR
jgi:hypothetical protein